MIVCAGGDIWLNHFATVLFNVWSSVTVECCVLYPCCVGACVCSYVRKKALLQCLQLLRRDMGLYEVPLSTSLLGFGMGTMLANFHMCGIMLVLEQFSTCS